MTSAVTSTPCALAHRITSTEPAVETWAMWTRLPVCRASMTSRATIDSSAMPGQPGSPSRPGELALVGTGVGTGEARVLRVLADHAAERLDVLQRAAHQPRVRDAVPVVGEHPHPGPRAGHEAQLGQLLAGQRLGDRADRLDVDEVGGPAEVVDVVRGLGGVGDGRGVGHGQDRGEPAGRRRLGSGGDGLGVLAARFAQVDVQVDQAGQRDQAVGVDHAGVGVRRQRADLDDPVAVEEQVGGVAPEQPGALDEGLHAVAPVSPLSRW